MSTSRGYVPSAADRDWIESIAEPIHPALAAIEAAAAPEGIPILDRESGRVLAVMVAGRRRIVEVGTAYGYSKYEFEVYGAGSTTASPTTPPTTPPTT